MSLYHELKRRNVFRVAIAYLAGSWLLVEVSETLFPVYGLSDAAIRLVVTVLAIGFPLLLIFSWVFELTPEGLRREVDVLQEHSITRFTGKKLDRIIMVLLALALGYFAFDKFVLDPAQDVKIAESAAQAGAEQAREEARLGMWNEKSIAVLPFVNRSGLREDEWFTDGMHDELLSRLAHIKTLKVISRTSVMRYRDSDKSLPEIARELSVSTILEGGVQRVGNQVRINVQLINAHSDEHLWAEIFDREMTSENLFATQSEISAKIAEALNTELSPQEESRIHDLPTSSLEAYNHYLHGRQLWATGRTEEQKQALGEFEKAVEADPDFALAWVGVADTSMSLLFKGVIGVPELAERSRQAIDKALALDDQLGEAYATLANVLNILEDKQEEAKAACNKAIELNPNYAPAYIRCAGLLVGWGAVYLETRLAWLYKAAQLDPLSPGIQVGIGYALSALGRDDEALAKFNHLLQTDPGYANAYIAIGRMHERQGRLAEAIQWYRQAVERDQGGGHLLGLAMAYLSLGDYEAVARIREEISESLGSDTWHLINLDYNVKLAQWKMDELLDVLDRFSPEEMESYWLLQWKGFAELFRGELHKAHEYYLKGDPRWADPDQWSKLITQNRKDACMFAGLLLSIGEESQGRELLRQLRRHNEEILPALLPVLLEDSYRNQAVGLCYLAEGSYEKALDFYEQRIERGYIWESWRGGFGWRAVDKLPWWNPIREHPRYIAMATRIEEKQSEQRELLRSMDDAGITVP